MSISVVPQSVPNKTGAVRSLPYMLARQFRLFRPSRFSLAILIAGLPCLPALASAAETTAYNENVTFTYGGKAVQTLSSSTPVAASSGLGSSANDGIQSYYSYNATSYQTPSSVNVYHNSASGVGTYSVNSAYTVTKTFVNTGSTTLNLAYNLNLYDSGLYNQAGTYTGNDFVASALGYNLTLNGKSVWNSSASLTTSSSGTQFVTAGTDLHYYNGGGFSNALGTYYTAGDMSTLVSLGSLQAGQSLTVDYILTAAVSGQGHGGVLDGPGGDCTNGDFNSTCPNGSWAAADGRPPFDAALRQDGFVVTASAVPEPAEWMLVLGGLVMVAAMTRRRMQHAGGAVPTMIQ